MSVDSGGAIAGKVAVLPTGNSVEAKRLLDESSSAGSSMSAGSSFDFEVSLYILLSLPGICSAVDADDVDVRHDMTFLMIPATLCCTLLLISWIDFLPAVLRFVLI
jgi:hypothetical protein